MSEPSGRAEALEPVLPGRPDSGVWRWHLEDDRIGQESDAYAVPGPHGAVLIDPLPLAPAALRRLEPVQAICLTAACHQRSAWRFRRRFGVAVHAPRGCRTMEGEPDRRYRAGSFLPGGLRAVATPGPDPAHHAFLWPGPPRILFCGDLLMRQGDGPLERVPEAYHDAPEDSRRSLRQLLDLDFEILCLAHGAPLAAQPRSALRRLLG